MNKIFGRAWGDLPDIQYEGMEMDEWNEEEYPSECLNCGAEHGSACHEDCGD